MGKRTKPEQLRLIEGAWTIAEAVEASVTLAAAPLEHRQLIEQMTRSRALDVVILALMRAKRVATPTDAIEFLIELLASYRPEAVGISVADLRGHRHGRGLTRLRRQHDTERAPNNWNVDRWLGIRTHEVLLAAQVGALPNGATIAWLRDGWLATPTGQLAFGWQPRLVDPRGCFGAKDLLAEVAPGKVSDRLLSLIEAHWREMSVAISLDENCIQQLQAGLPYLGELRRLLLPVFGEQVLKVLAQGQAAGPRGRHLAMATLMTWAAGLLRIYRRGPEPIFRETRIIVPNSDDSLGRIDGLRVRAIGGKRPRGRQARILWQLCRCRFTDIWRLLTELERFLGQCEVELFDLKEVGDSLRRGRIIQRQEIVVRPIPLHATQIVRYLSVPKLVAMMSGEMITVPASFPRSGSLRYLLPTDAPIDHQINAGSTATAELFEQRIAPKLKTAAERARFRVAENFLLAVVSEIIEGRKPATNRGNRNGHGQFRRRTEPDQSSEQCVLTLDD